MKKFLALALVLCMAMPVVGLAEGASEGKYVYKDHVTNLATNWNPHTFQTTDDAYPSDTARIRIGLYDFIYNDASNPVEGKEPFAGYKAIPEMAASEPVDVTEEIRAAHPEFNIPASATSGFAYTIDLNEKAVWEDGTPINADTYVYSMKRLLDPTLLNYRATDYYAQNFSIAGAEAYANSGRTIKKDNCNSDALADADYIFADLVKGEDGAYSTADGHKAYFGLQNKLSFIDNSLDTFAAYFPEGVWDKLVGMADANGYVPVTDESTKLITSFITSDNWGNEPVENLSGYFSYEISYPTVTFEDAVGLYKSGDYQITLVLDKALSGFNLLYALNNNWIVHEELYEKCLKKTGDAWTSTYNTSVDTTLAYGPYKLSNYEADKNMHFVRNETWYGYSDGRHTYVDPVDGETYDMYMTDEIDCQPVAEAATSKLMFLKGQLMTYGLQAEDFATYRNSEYVHATPGDTIFFLILNGYKSVLDEREASEGFDTAKYDLQTLTLLPFRKAVAVTYDKELFASTVSPSRSGAYGLIGNLYVYDPETGARYRDTDQAKKALCDFYSVDPSAYASLDEAVASITGYDEPAAKLLYKEAFDEAIKLGYITDTNNDGISDQTIRIEYCSSATSSFIDKVVAYLNEKMLDVTVGTPFAGKIEFYVSAPYGNDWSNKIKAGLSDTVLAGWNGSAMNPFSLSEQYANPSYAYDGKWFDATKANMTLTVKVNDEEKELTASLSKWSDMLNGSTVTLDGVEYNFGEGYADINTRLSILAAFEAQILGTYDYLPMLQDAGMTLLTQQAFYVVEEYSPIMARGGFAYLKYNYTEDEWNAFVASQPDGTLSY